MCLLYGTFLTRLDSLIEQLYQNATSKNREKLKKIKNTVEKRNKVYIILFWPLYELYSMILRNE
jgi:hypothetical protein